MSEYTVTYPVHLGQEVWVDTRALPYVPPAIERGFLKGDVRSFTIRKKAGYAEKTMKIRIFGNWATMNGRKDCYKYFNFVVSAMGKTVFDEETPT